MGAITVLKFDTAAGATRALEIMRNLQEEHLIYIQDAATVTWAEGKRKPKTQQTQSKTGEGATWGAFWGMLFGLLFFMPIMGAAIGAGIGALSGHFTDVGIDDDFIKEVRSQVTEGTSALFLMTTGASPTRLIEEMKKQMPKFEIISTNLSEEQEEALRAAFAEEEE
jgi:uncharacterized membrane protein